jgi:probable HAF family extracellular repeat protein
MAWKITGFWYRIVALAVVATLTALTLASDGPAGAAGQEAAVTGPEVAASPGPMSSVTSGRNRWNDDDPATRPRSESPVFVLSGGRFMVFDAPGRGSNYFPRISNRGDVVGIYNKEVREPRSTFGGYVRDRRGRFTEIAFPGAVSTLPLDINDRGVVVGAYDRDADGAFRGFVRDRRGRYRTIHFPGSVISQAYGINNRGQIVGDYRDADGITHGYLWHDGRFTTIDGPHGTEATSLTEINDRGQILGIYSNESGASSGFLLTRGRYSTFDGPDGPFTFALGLNNRGRIVGFTTDALEGAGTEFQGFVLRDGADGPVTRIEIPGALGTGATGINDRGQIVGRYGNPNATTGAAPTDIASIMPDRPAGPAQPTGHHTSPTPGAG